MGTTFATISLVVSAISLGVALLTAWLTLLRRGRVRMTQPTVIYFGPDGGHHRPSKPKIFLRSLLYSTAARGRIITSMFVRLRRGETTQNFNIWVHGDHMLSRGSGLFVPQEGVAYNHHFLLPADASDFRFVAGHYTVEVFANMVGREPAERLFEIELDVDSDAARALNSSDIGLYFDWGPDSARYHAHLREPPKEDFPEWFRDFFERHVPPTAAKPPVAPFAPPSVPGR